MDSDDNETSEVSDKICCFCGNDNIKLISVFSDEAIENDIPTLIEMYLPIRFSEYDGSALTCCRACISTIVSWHGFVEKAVATTQLIPKENLNNKLEDVKKVEYESVEMKEGTVDYSPSIQLLVVENGSNESKVIYVYNDEITKDEDHYTEPLQNTLIRSGRKTSNKVKQNRAKTDDRRFSLRHKKRIKANTEKENEEIEDTKYVRPRQTRIILREFFCDYCSSGFTRKHGKKRHILQMHPTSEQAKMLRQSNYKQLRDKYKIFVRGKVFFQCDTCSHRTKDFKMLRRHISTHADV